MKVNIFDTNWIEAPCPIQTKHVVLKAVLNTILPAFKFIPMLLCIIFVTFVVMFGVGWLCNVICEYANASPGFPFEMPKLFALPNLIGVLFSAILFVVSYGFFELCKAIIKRYRKMIRYYRFKVSVEE